MLNIHVVHRIVYEIMMKIATAYICQSINRQHANVPFLIQVKKAPLFSSPNQALALPFSFTISLTSFRKNEPLSRPFELRPLVAGISLSIPYVCMHALSVGVDPPPDGDVLVFSLGVVCLVSVCGNLCVGS